jgi:xanthine dehydrogenase accessory factor
MAFFNSLVLIRGAGDLGSGVAYRFVKAGFPVIMTELPEPTLVRTTVSYGICVFGNPVIVGGIIARRSTVDDALGIAQHGIIPVVVDPTRSTIETLHPQLIIDARVAKVNLDTTIQDADLVVALGPGFTAGVDCHAVIETNRGHDLGRVLWQGAAEPDTGSPGTVNGRTGDRVLRAPVAGRVRQVRMIGERVKESTTLAYVNDVPVAAPFDGVIRGLLDDVSVPAGLKIGDIDPRAKREYCFTLSDKSLAIGGGALEAALSWLSRRLPRSISQKES